MVSRLPFQLRDCRFEAYHLLFCKFIEIKREIFARGAPAERSGRSLRHAMLALATRKETCVPCLLPNARIHSLAIVGYAGKGVDRVKYGIAKHSWCEKWGKEGYVWLKKDGDEPEGLCGLAIAPVYPIV